MRMKLFSRFALFLAAISIAGVQCVNEADSDLLRRSNSLPETTPWNLEQLSKAPKFEWDEGNSLHLQLGHGIEPEEAEEVFANKPFYRKTKRGHYAVFGPTLDGRYLTIIFELKSKGIVRPITGWDVIDGYASSIYLIAKEIKDEQTGSETKKLDPVL